MRGRKVQTRKNKPAAEQNDEIKGGGRVDKEQLFFDNKALALNIAHGYFEDKYAAVEREDYEQMALMYLWEASMEYKESEQTKFSTFATTYIKNSFADYFRHIKRQKRAALYQRETDRNQENDNLEESLKNLEAENTGEDSLSYQLLRLDLERDLLRERRKLRKSEKSTAAGLEILYAILKGVSGAEIMETMEIPESSYYRCVKKARKHLWQVAMA